MKKVDRECETAITCANRMAGLYRTCIPKEIMQLAELTIMDTLEWTYVPKHGDDLDSQEKLELYIIRDGKKLRHDAKLPPRNPSTKKSSVVEL